MNDEEAILNRLKQNQAYNDHIVSQQASIIKQFDKVDDLENHVSQLNDQVRLLTAHHESLKNNYSDELVKAYIAKDYLYKSVVKLDSSVNEITQAICDCDVFLKCKLTDLDKYIDRIYKELEEFKARWLKELVDLDNDLAKYKQDMANQLKDGLADNLKQIPETPPNIQDLKDTVTHKMRVFEIEVAKAVDKANHAEMLYKVVEKRTRQ